MSLLTSLVNRGPFILRSGCLLLLEGAAITTSGGGEGFRPWVVGHQPAEPAEAPSQGHGGGTSALPARPMRRPLGTALGGSWLGKIVQGIYIMQGSNSQQVDVQFPGLV